MRSSPLKQPFVVVDSGGSSTRLAAVKSRRLSTPVSVQSLQSLDDLVDQIARVSTRPSGIAVSIAAFVERSTGFVRLSRHAPWSQGPLADRLAETFSCAVDVMNDGEAHALAMLGDPDVKLGAISVSLGTAVGIGIMGAGGRVLRPLSGENWDLGELRLHTRASRKELWWALGSEGLAELQRNLGVADGTAQYGYRLGSALRELTVIFQPATIMLSGGIAFRLWSDMRSTIADELHALPSHARSPRVLLSPHREAALVGLSRLSDREVARAMRL